MPSRATNRDPASKVYQGSRRRLPYLRTPGELVLSNRLGAILAVVRLKP